MAEAIPSAAEAKACCALAYESEWAKLLLGDSFHPGGLGLTLHLGRLVGLSQGMDVLDVACGRGASAIALAKECGCRVHGIDLSAANVALAEEAAAAAGIAHLATFAVGDAERLPCGAASFDAVICECAFCTFPAKTTAAREFARVLRAGGRLGLSDVTRQGALPTELDSLLGRVACVADALPLESYAALLVDAGLSNLRLERHDKAMSDLVARVMVKLLGVEVLARVGKAPVPLADVLQAKGLARLASDCVKAGVLGYGIVTAAAAGGPA